VGGCLVKLFVWVVFVRRVFWWLYVGGGWVWLFGLRVRRVLFFVGRDVGFFGLLFCFLFGLKVLGWSFQLVVFLFD